MSAGGIVSTAYCILYKLFTLKLTRKQLTGMLNHVDSPYIRGLGFLYIRYCQPPSDFNEWFEPYFDDDEEIDLKAGGGYQTTVGEMCKMMVSKLDWFGTLFPRIPVNLQKMFMEKFKKQRMERQEEMNQEMAAPIDTGFGEAEKRLRDTYNNSGSRGSKSRDGSRERSERRSQRSRSRSRERRQDLSRDRLSRNDKDRRYRSPGRRRSNSRERRRDRSRERKSRDQSRERKRSRSRERSRDRRRSRSRDRKSRHHSRSPRR